MRASTLTLLVLLSACAACTGDDVAPDRGAAAAQATPACAGAAGARPTIGFGAEPRYNPVVMYRYYQPLLDYLSAHSPYHFELRLADTDRDAVSALEEGRVDVALLGGVTYLMAHARFGARALVVPLDADGQPFYRGVFVVREDSPLRELADLRGHSLALCSGYSASGGLVARWELSRLGLSLDDLERSAYLRHHELVIRAVLEGSYDAGAVDEAVAQRYIGRGLRVLHVSGTHPGAADHGAPGRTRQRGAVHQRRAGRARRHGPGRARPDADVGSCAALRLRPSRGRGLRSAAAAGEPDTRGVCPGMPRRPPLLSRLRYGLEAKFVVLATAVILAASLVGNRLVFAYVRDQLHDKVRREAVVLAESMARSFLHTLIYEDLGLVQEAGLLQQHIEDVVSRPDMAVRFVEVVNPRSQVIAHSGYRWYGRVDSSVAQRYGADLQETRTAVAERDAERVLEVAAPLRIASRSWGVLVLAVSLVPVEHELEHFAIRLWMLTVAAIAVSVPLAFLVARALARPVKRLAIAMSQVGPDLSTDLRVDRLDEIGLLQSSFLGMLERLRQAQLEQEQTRKAMLRAEKLASVGALASGVAHEVNNPLGGIRNCLAQLEAYPDDRERRLEYMGLMGRALDRIEQVVRGLLDFSGRSELEVVPVSLEQTIRSTLELARYRLDSSHIECCVEVEPDLPPVMGDRHHLEQVLVNLVLNAADTMEGGGQLYLRAFRQGGSVGVCVQDSGPGVPAELGERVFDPFFSTKEVGRGTGLGLTVSLSIVRAHGGDLSYTNSPGGGAAFTILLPTRPAASAAQEAGAS